MKSQEDERIIEDYLSRKGLRAEKFTKEERRKHKNKTPDLRVFKGERCAFYCEIKTIAKDEWFFRQLDRATPGTIVKCVRHDPIFNRLSQKIHEAVQQFDAVNPDQEYPNVLAFVNHDPKCICPNDLRETLTGDFVNSKGIRHRISSNISEGRIKEEKFRVHFFIWIDVYKSPKRIRLLINGEPPKDFKDRLVEYFDMNPGSIQKL